MSKLMIPLNACCDESYEVILNSTIEVGAQFPVTDQTIEIIHRGEPISCVRLVDDAVLTPEKLRGIADQLEAAINVDKPAGLVTAPVDKIHELMLTAKNTVNDMKHLTGPKAGLYVFLAEVLARQEGLTLYASEVGYVPAAEVSSKPSPATDCQTVSENEPTLCEDGFCDDCGNDPCSCYDDECDDLCADCEDNQYPF